MIDFKCEGPDIQRASFGGAVDDLAAEVCLEIALMYGALKSRDEDLANEFKLRISLAFIADEARSHIFSSEVYNAVKGSGSQEIVIDRGELERQLQELLKNEGQ